VKKWLENNPVGIVLAAVCGLLLASSLLLGVKWSLPASGAAVGDASDDDFSLSVAELGDAAEISAYSDVIERPVFNESRRPIVLEDPDEGSEDDLMAQEEADPDAPEVELAGIVITPSVRMVTLRHKDLEESLVAFEGQPLEGDFGSWHISRIDAREATLSSAGGEEVLLTLQVHDQTITAPEKSVPVAFRKDREQAEGSESPEKESGDPPLSRAEEIRQRIAERREELRRAAEERADNREDDRPEPANYQDAMQSLIVDDRPGDGDDGRP
jgi:hypothetical protein